MIRAVLFDAVGTLIHLREPVGATYARYAAECGVQVSAGALQSAFAGLLRGMPPMVFPGRTAADVRAEERGWWRTLVRSVFEAAGVATPFPNFEHCFERLFVHFSGADAWRAATGAGDLLRALRGRGLRTGMVSNFDHRLPALLDALDLAALLDAIVLPADAGAAKPDARIFAIALARLEVRADEAVYVGDDARDDIAGAQGAGLRAVDVASWSDLRSLETCLIAPR